MNFISVMPLGCTASVNHYSSLMVYTIIPILIGIVLIIGTKVVKKPKLKNKFFEVFLAMTFIVLPTVSVKIFSTFACRKFDGEYGSYLKVRKILIIQVISTFIKKLTLIFTSFFLRSIIQSLATVVPISGSTGCGQAA